MAALVIREDERAALRELVARAEAAPVDMLTLMLRLASAEGKAAHMAQMTAQSLMLSVGFVVTFSIELGHGGGAARHMSMSTQREGRVPHPEALWMVAEELGFVGGLEACDKVWPERLRQGLAVNVVQLIATADAYGKPQ
jgi:hypothetical protein